MADIGLTNTPLIRDLYNTSEEAILAAARLGISGYRVYNVNGETKYVPGATYIEYEKAISIIKIQGKIAARGDEVFGDKLVGLQFANAKTEIQGDPFFTFGNFSITTSATRLEENAIVNNDAPKTYTGQQILDQVNENAPLGYEILLDDVVNRIDENLRVKINFDKRKLENHVLYSSLKERIKQTINEIILQFPAAIHFTPVSIQYPTVIKCEQIIDDNQSIITLSQSAMLNPLKVEYLKSAAAKEDSVEVTKLRNFSKTFNQYVLFYKGIEYPILSAVLPENETDTFKIVVQGLPFKSVLSTTFTVNADFYIKPSKGQFDLFYDNLSDLAGFLMNVGGDGRYVANIFVPVESEFGDVVNQVQTVVFPTYDEVNIDIVTDKFDEYLTALNNVADDLDAAKTNIIARFLTTESLQEFDTEDRKFNVLLQLYGRQFDQVKQYIDGLTYVKNLSYDKIENIPDALLKNFARMIGLKTFEIQDEDTLIKSLFNFDETEIEGDLTPAELDIEIWRRLLTNAFYLFKSKGTRKSIEFVMKLIGVPDPIIEINEYIYLADSKINTIETNALLFGNDISISGTDLYPYDGDGYPTTPKGVHYQANGGNLRVDDMNIGPYDFGKVYIKEYTKFEDGVYGFDLYRTIDNQKSWVESYSEQYRENYHDLRHTYYYEKDSRLAVNSKEIEVYVSLDRIFDVYPYRYFSRNGIVLDGEFGPYVESVDASKLTFDQYLNEVLTKYINVRNRKTIRTYPTLSKIYYDYRDEVLNNNTENYIDFRKSMEFINKFDTYWIKFIEQFLPATSIVNAGKKITNSVYFQNKFKYRHGKNTDADVNWPGTDGSEFQNKALLPVWYGIAQAGSTTGKKNPSYYSKMDVFDISGVANRKYTAYDTSLNDYYGIQYSIGDYCEFKPEVFVWEPNIDYSQYQSGRRGVFVIYENKLYRLRSTETDDVTNIIPSDSSSYDLVDKYVDSNLVTFTDCPDPNYFERDYFIDIIGFAFAYKMLDVDFDCPPPKPHVCYHDFYGRDIVFDITGATQTSTTTAAIAPTGGTGSIVFKNLGAPSNSIYGAYLFNAGYATNGNGSISQNLTTALWKNIAGNTSDGRLNTIGVWPSANAPHPYDEWVGFSYKITVPVAKTVYFGVSAHNRARVKHNGAVKLELSASATSIYGSGKLNEYWLIYPLNLVAGNNFIEVEGMEQSTYPSSGVIGFEIYDMTSTAIVNATLESDLTIIYSTLDEVGSTFDLGSNGSGYSCPTTGGWFLDTSSGTPVCRKYSISANDTNSSLTYTDELGAVRAVRQPRYYGYSNHFASGKPINALYGKSPNWAVPFTPKRIWTTGNTYYSGEIVTYNDNHYIMTDDVLATTSVITGATATNVIPGLYEQYQERKKSDPFMHIQPAYLDVFTIDPTTDKLSINLTKNLALWHIFSGATQDTTFRVTDNIIDDQIYISDSISVGDIDLRFDGFYPIDNTKLGPSYTVNDDESYVNTVSDSLVLRTGVMNYIDLRGLSTGFTNNSTNFILTDDLPGYYLVNNTSFLTFKFDLYFESVFRGDQDVIAYLVNQNGNVLNEERFSFNGSDPVENRIMNFVCQSVYLANQRLFLAIKPLSQDCSLVRFEKISFNYNERDFNDSNYYELYDTRFRLNFNGGRLINDGYYVDPVISISPVANTFKVNTTEYRANDDKAYASVNPFTAYKYQPRTRMFNEIEFTEDISQQYPFNYFFEQYYRKYQTNIKQSLIDPADRFGLDRDIPYNKLDFNFSYQTRKIPANANFNANNIVGETVHVSATAASQYLGNTLVDHENAQPTKNIVIGSSPTLRSVVYDSSITIDADTEIDLYGYSTGLNDYTDLNYRNKQNYYELNYVNNPTDTLLVTGSTVLAKDIDRPVPSRSVRSNGIYKSVLQSAEYFDKRIINYKLNDVVKVKDSVLNEDVLYVCVKDVELYHYDQTGILPKFVIGGEFSLFVEITKYVPKNYEVSGYKDSTTPLSSKIKLTDYIDNDIILTVTGTTDYSIEEIKPGQIIKWVSGPSGTTRYHKLVYNKTLKYNPTYRYLPGDYILYDGKFYICIAEFTGNGLSTPSPTYFTLIDPVGSATWLSDQTTHTVNSLKQFYNAVELPAVPQITIDSTINTAWVANTLYFMRAKKYNGQPFTAYGYMPSLVTDYPIVDQYTIPIANTVSSIQQGAYPVAHASWKMYHSFEANNSYMPLFEVVTTEPDAPMYYEQNKVYNVYEDAITFSTLMDKSMSDNKVIFNNKLYNFIGTGTWSGSLTSTPASNPLLWESKDFMLVESLLFYRERSRVRIYDGEVISLTDDMKENFEIFTPELNYKEGFGPGNYRATHQFGEVVDGHTITSFDVINEQLENGLNLISEIKDSNRKLVVRYGKSSIRREQNDLILDYFFQRDETGNLPVTGEFAGLLHFHNPCGHSASVVVGAVLTNQQNSLDLIKPRDLDIIKLETPVPTVPYTVRLILTQTGRANGTLTWSGAASGSVVISEDSVYDKVLLVEPDKELTFTFNYNVANNQSRLDFAYLDTTNLFPKSKVFSNKLVDTDLVMSSAAYDDNTRTETRVITIKTTKQNHVLRVGLRGIERPNLKEDIRFTNIINLDRDAPSAAIN